jgi:hypothetical protein
MNISREMRRKRKARKKENQISRSMIIDCEFMRNMEVKARSQKTDGTSAIAVL